MAKNIMGNNIVGNRNAIIKNVPLKQEVAVLIISTECFGTMEKRDILEKVSEVHKKLGGRETPESRIQTSVTAALN